MSADDALKAARAAGIQLGVDGEDLVLMASVPPPAAVIDLLASHKAEVVALLRPGRDSWSAHDWQVFFDERAGTLEFAGGLPWAEAEAQAFTCCVVEWLNRHPTPSAAGRCVWCGKPETPSAMVRPFGAGEHAWLHSECWPPWHQSRQAEAARALKGMGIPPGSFGRSP